MLGVTTYLACVSVLHIASITIMQFTAFNSTSIIPVQSSVTWPSSTTYWEGPNQIVPPSNLLQNTKTIGLINNTIYDIVNTTDPAFTTAIMNATSLQANCGLLSNLTFSNSGSLPTFNFSIDGLGNTSLFGSKSLGFQCMWVWVIFENFIAVAFQNAENQIVFLTSNSVPVNIFCFTIHSFQRVSLISARILQLHVHYVMNISTF